MKKIAPKLKMAAAAKGLTLTDLVKEINALQAKAGYNKRPLTRVGIYRYATEQAPQDRIYAICAILNTHPKKLFEDWYDEDLLAFYKNIYKSS